MDSAVWSFAVAGAVGVVVGIVMGVVWYGWLDR